MTPPLTLAPKPECPDGWHRWEPSGSWGVIFGVTKCLECGKRATKKDFPAGQEKQS